MAWWLGFGFSNGKPGQSHREAITTAQLGLAYLGSAWLGLRPQARPCKALLVVPLEPVVTNYRIIVPITGKMIQCTVQRQFSLTAAYAFTDYRSQGQTILYVLVDIVSPSTGGLSLFNLYVTLSRSFGRATIRLLRDFDDPQFLKQHNQSLINEDERLEGLDMETRRWYDCMVWS